MSIKNLNFLLNPSSVALIGASSRPHSVGEVILKNILHTGFKGDVFLVNPRYQFMGGLPAYPNVASLPRAPDLAVIAVPPDCVPEVMAQLGACGAKAAVVITACLGEGGSQRGRELRRAMLEAAQRYSLRIVGPNSLGVIVPKSRLNASMAHISPPAGGIAFVSHSGALQTAVLDWAASQNIGFSHVISLGGLADVDFGDMLDYLSTDLACRAILLYLEGITNARKFMSAARAAARMKPVIVLKGGRHKEAAQAAEKHTGTAPGIDAVYDAAFRRAGMLRVRDIQALFSAVGTLARMPRSLKGDNMAILTNGGGIGVLATDVLIDEGGHLARLCADTMRRLNGVLPPMWSHWNPVDIGSDAPPARYASALESLLKDESIDGILILNAPYAVASSKEVTQAVINTIKRHPGRKPVILTCWLGGAGVVESRRLFVENHVPTYETPAEAVRAFMQMIRYQASQAMLMETPPSIPDSFLPDAAKARQIVNLALAEGRGRLRTGETGAVLDAYRIPRVLQPAPASDSSANDILGPEASVLRSDPGEFFIEAVDDEHFGPVIRFSCGLTDAGLLERGEFALPPLNLHLASELICRARSVRSHESGRSENRLEREGAALTLVKVSQIISDIDEISGLGIHLASDRHGPLAVNAEIRVGKSRAPAGQRLAIRPYPKELEAPLSLRDGRILQIRPIRPEDEPLLLTFFSRLSAKEIRLRFLHPMGELSHSQAARLTQIDYDREMALVATGVADSKKLEFYGHVQLLSDPDNEKAEFSIVVRHDASGKGLGRILMERIIEYARSRGMKEIFGDVFFENRPMLRLAQSVGFASRIDFDNPGSVIVSLKL
jgi:acetyltransferase